MWLKVQNSTWCQQNSPSHDCARNDGCCHLTIYLRFNAAVDGAHYSSHSLSLTLPPTTSFSINSIFCILFLHQFLSFSPGIVGVFASLSMIYQAVCRKTNTLLLCKQATVLCFIIHFIWLCIHRRSSFFSFFYFFFISHLFICLSSSPPFSSSLSSFSFIAFSLNIPIHYRWFPITGILCGADLLSHRLSCVVGVYF